MARNELFERRKYRRLKVEVPVKHREVLSDDFISENRSLSASSAINISKGGMQIITDAAWTETGDRLIETEFNVNGRDIKVVSHIVWVALDSAIKKYRSGLEFIMVKSGDLEIIENLN